MAEFVRDNTEMFLAVVRKYMQLRGPMTQKELADLTGTGVSTMSRFLNQKTNDLNAQLIANIVAKLQVPLHEIIEFVDEDYTDKFVRLVKFYKGDDPAQSGDQGSADAPSSPPAGDDSVDMDEALLGSLSSGTAKRNVSANINVGGKKRTVSFHADHDAPFSELSLKEKIGSLSARQKGFLNDFLNLDMDGRDLIVDIGKNVISYLRQKGMEL